MMQIVISRLQNQPSVPEAVLRHGDEYLYFPMGGKNIRKASQTDQCEMEIMDGVEVFLYLNRYWSSLQHERICDIFHAYKDINDILVDISFIGEKETAGLLLRRIKTLLDLHPLGDIEHWIMRHSDIIIPTDLVDEFTTHDGRSQGTVERTYLRSDYIRLIAMLIGLKAVLPVLLCYMMTMQGVFGQAWLEYETFKLINLSDYADCEAMTRLKLYVESSLVKSDNQASSKIEGLSGMDFTDWLTASLLLKRLLVADISGSQATRGSQPLMGVLYKFVKSGVTEYVKSFRGTIHQKTEESASSEEGSNISYLEGFKAREALSAGDILELEVFFRDPINDTYLEIDKRYAAARTLIPEFQNMMTVFSTQDKGTGYQPIIHKWQQAIVEFVLKDYLPARSLGVIARDVEFNCFSVALSFLWVMGYKDLALVLSSFDVGKIRQVEPAVNKLSKETATKLFELYPHDVCINRKTDKYRNAAITTIDLLIRDIVLYERKINTNIPRWMRDEVGLRTTELNTNPDLRNRLGELVVELF